MRARKKRSYYSVHMLKDGTVLFAVETRKPTQRKGERPRWIDQDGVHNEFVMEYDRIRDLEVPIRASLQSTIAMTINTKRLLREIVEPRLGAIEKSIEGISSRLESVDSKLDPLLEAMTGLKK